MPLAQSVPPLNVTQPLTNVEKFLALVEADKAKLRSCSDSICSPNRFSVLGEDGGEVMGGSLEGHTLAQSKG